MIFNGLFATIAEWFAEQLVAPSGQILFYDRTLKTHGSDRALSFKYDADEDDTPVVDLASDFEFTKGEFRARSFRGQLFHGWDANHGDPDGELTRFKGGDAPAGIGANARVEGGEGDTPVNHGIVQVQDVLQLGSLNYADLPMTRVLEWGGGAMAFILDANASAWGDVITGGGSEGRLAGYNGTDWRVIA